MTEPIHLQPISPVTPNLALSAAYRKDLIPLIVEIIIIRAAVEALQAWGKEIAKEGVRARKIHRATELHRRQIKAEYIRIESIPHHGKPLPSSLYLGYTVQQSTPA